MRSTTNLYFGNDPTKWRRAIPNLGASKCRELYRGIDLAYYGNGAELEYDLTVNPGADARQIRLRFKGTDAKPEPRMAIWCRADPEASGGLSNRMRMDRGAPLRAAIARMPTAPMDSRWAPTITRARW